MVRRHGFTLVELSIVLVIIGLLTGGVLTGQSLIRAAELRSVTSQYERILTATQAFHDKYLSFPGDMPNATNFWGAADGSTGNTPGCATIASSNALTCNGNGDDILTVSTNSDERYRFWQHLANAGLIEGSYIGTWNGGSGAPNSPAGRITNSYWYVDNLMGVYSNGIMFNGDYGNHFMVGATHANDIPSTPIFKPEEAYNIDTKLDDGKPGSGKIMMRGYPAINNCANTTDPTNFAADYLVSSQVFACTLYFRNQF